MDLIDRLGKGRLEFGVAHRNPKVLDKRAREARDHAVIGGKALAGIGPGIAAGEGDDAIPAGLSIMSRDGFAALAMTMHAQAFTVEAR